MTAGDILFHTDFVFRDGTHGKKLLIVLNTPDVEKDEPYLIIRTTSRMKGKQIQQGCIAAWKMFFIASGGGEYFTEPTLLQLDYIYEMNAASAVRNGLQQSLTQVGNLSQQLFGQVKNCIKEIKEDVSEKHYHLIFRK